MSKKKEAAPQPVSKFTEGFSALCYQKGWVLPPGYVNQVYEQAILNLEKQVAELTGERNGRRIDPIKPTKITVVSG